MYPICIPLRNGLDKLDTRYWMLVKSKIKNQKSRIKIQESRIPRSGQTPNTRSGIGLGFEWRLSWTDGG